MAKKTHFAMLMVALSFMLGACANQSVATAPAKDKRYDYETTHNKNYPLVARFDRY